MSIGYQGSDGVARVFTQHSERLANTWRHMRHSHLGVRSHRHLAIGDVVEGFIQNLGESLRGTEGSPWSRTQGVLRLSRELGFALIDEEFGALRQCLVDAVHAAHGSPQQAALVQKAIAEARDSTVALLNNNIDPMSPPPVVPFGGWMVEHFGRDLLSEPREEIDPLATFDQIVG